MYTRMCTCMVYSNVLLFPRDISARSGHKLFYIIPLTSNESPLPVQRNREPDTEHKEVTQEKRSAVKPKPEHRLQDVHMCARQRVQNRPVNAPG